VSLPGSQAVRPAARIVRLGTLAGACAAGVQGLPRALGYPPLRRLLPGLEGRGRSDHVALTFDDGPDPQSTPAILQALASVDVRATFFVLGSMMDRSGDLMAETAELGHDVGVHGWDHGAQVLRGPMRVRGDLLRTQTMIQDLTGIKPAFYRPPYGKLTASSLWAANYLGLRTVLWSAWGEDWTEAATGASALETLRPDLLGGATILLHDSDCQSVPGSWRAALECLAPLVEELRRQGLKVGPMSEHGLTKAWR
jgi:peptidoglycan/xylan/chitin deacetylase (PgdA/CDA1 family)